MAYEDHWHEHYGHWGQEVENWSGVAVCVVCDQFFTRVELEFLFRSDIAKAIRMVCLELDKENA